MAHLTEQEFVVLVRDELGLPLVADDLDVDLDTIVSWDSIHVVTLVIEAERRTGRRMQVSKLMTARSLREIYDVLEN